MSKFNKFVKKPGGSREIRLELTHDPKDGHYTSNFYKWTKMWEETLLGTYGDEVVQQYDNDDYEGLTDELIVAMYPIQSEVPLGKETWLPTDEEQEDILAEENQLRQDWMITRLYNVWRVNQIEPNNIIKLNNSINIEKRKLLIVQQKSMKDVNTKVFADILSTMTENSREIVMAYRTNDIDTEEEVNGDATTISNNSASAAKREGNWKFLFRAAEQTHIARLSVGQTAVSRRARQLTERKKLESLYHKNGLFTHWLSSWRDQLNSCYAVQLEFSDEEKMLMFMECINIDIFEKVQSEWNSPLTHSLMPHTFEPLVQYINCEFERQANSRPLVVSKVERLQKPEQVLVIKEIAKDKSASKSDNKKCFICNGDHLANSCKHRNKEYTIEQNKWYLENGGSKKKKGVSKTNSKNIDTSTSTSVPQIPSGGGKSSAWDPTKGAPVPSKESVNFISLVDCQETSLFDPNEESVYQVKVVIPKYIELTYDTGSEASTMGPEGAAFLHGLHKDPAVLGGYGGGVVNTSLAGYSTFGKTRVLRQEGNKNLVSHALAEQQWQIVHTPGCFTLREWEDKRRTTDKTWSFRRDPVLYGDELLHLRLTPDEFEDFTASANTYVSESVNNVYQPAQQVVSEIGLTDLEHELIRRVQDVHTTFNHLSAQAMLRLMDSASPLDAFGITREDIELWQRHAVSFCEGCLRGKMKEHSRVPSSIREVMEVGTSGAADLMFIDQLRGSKTPLYLHVDIGSKMLIGVPLLGKYESEIIRAISVVQGTYISSGHLLKHITFDRESAIVSSTSAIQEKGITLKLKAAGQHVGLIEVSIAQVRAHARATKAGVRADLLYNPMIQWNNDLVLDTISTLNRSVRPSTTESPYQMFTKKEADYNRDFRIRWGEIVLAKKPRGISADLEDVSRWAIVVRRYMNRTGVLKVFILDTKRYAYVLKIARPKVPQRILDQINDMSVESNDILMEEGSSELDLVESVEPTVSTPVREDGVIEPIDLAEGDEPYEEFIHEPDIGYQELDIQDVAGEEAELPPIVQEAILHPEVAKLYNWMSPPVREKRQSVPPVRLVYTLYHEAVRNNPDAAKLAMKIEIANIKNNRVWKGCKLEWLTPDERKLILSIMSNYTEKYTPSDIFDKCKIRICIRGDQQVIVAETEGPVCRVETIFVLFSIAVFYNLEVFTIDFVSAYLNTPMPIEVKHRWVLLDRVVSQLLYEDDPEYWGEFMQTDRRILVELLKLMYGYKEAAHYWNKILMAMFALHGWLVQPKDRCLVVKHIDGHFGAIAITVDDLTCVVSKDSNLKEQIIEMCKSHFVNITLSEGDTIEVIGMTFVIDRVKRSVSVSQRKFVNKSCKNFNVVKKSVTPCTPDLFDEDPSEELLTNQLEFMSVNSTAMYGGKRTYPEVLPTTTYLATKYWKATASDMVKGLRVLEYFNHEDDHMLYLRPKSLNIVVSADASYAEHHDAKSHTGGCIGFEGYEGEASYFMFISTKQSVVAKSSCEAELIALNTVAEHVVWLQDLLADMGVQFVTGVPAAVEQDNTSTILMANRGNGTFKRTKHIKMRYFWVKDLIDAGVMVLSYTPTSLMVSDILTKPLGGSRFKTLRARLLGWTSKGAA